MAKQRQKAKVPVTPEAREVQRDVRYLLRGLRPEAVAVKLGVTVYTVYRWEKAKTAAHTRHRIAIQKLVAAEARRRTSGGESAAV